MEVTYLSDEHERLSKDVEVLFRQATSRFAVPTASGCAMVAFYLLGLRDTPQKHDKQPKAVRYGKLFLYHLSAERRQVEYWIALYSQGQPVEFWFRRDQELSKRLTKLSGRSKRCFRPCHRSVMRATRSAKLRQPRSRLGGRPTADVRRAPPTLTVRSAGSWPGL